MVLGLVWVTFSCQNDDQKEKGRFVEIVVLPMSYCCFQGLWAPFGVPEREKNRVGFRSGFKLGFMVILVRFENHFGITNRWNKNRNFYVFFRDSWGDPSLRASTRGWQNVCPVGL